MKTSKKLLSFFLAVVMVVTTCSVGFTAFAQDNKKSIWSTTCEAEDAFNTLNGLADDLLPSVLMGISSSISDPIYEKYAEKIGKTAGELSDAEKAVITGEATPTDEQKKAGFTAATLQDVLLALQPMLINLLDGTSQNDYPGVLGGLAESQDPSYYDYLLKYVLDEDGNEVLDENGNKILDEDAMSFFTLYAFCKEYQYKEGLSASTRATLSDWYKKLSEIANIPLVDETMDTILKHAKKYNEAADNGEALLNGTYDSATLTELELFYNDEYMASVSDEDKAILSAAYEQYENELKSYDYDVTIDSIATLLYYGFGMGQYYKYFDLYYSFIKSTGNELTVVGSYDLLNWGENAELNITDPITPENYVDTITYEALISLYGMDRDNPMWDDPNYDWETGSNPDQVPFNLDGAYDLFGAGDRELGKAACADMITKGFVDYVFPNYYKQIIQGMAIKYSDDIGSLADLDKLVSSRMPEGYETGDVFSDDEIMEIGSLFKTIGSASFIPVSNYFKNGSVIAADNATGVNVEVTPELPYGVSDTLLAEYFSLIFVNGNSNTAYQQKMIKAFFSEYYANNYQTFLALDGEPISGGAIKDPNEILRYEGSNLAVLNYKTGATFSHEDIADFVDDAETYAYTSITADLLGIDELISDKATEVVNCKIDYQAYLDSRVAKEDPKVVLTAEQKEILYGDYSLDNEMGTEIINYILNDTVVGIIGNEMVSGLITGMLGDVDLQAAIEDIWERLCNSPVATVFELLPVVVVLADNLLLPLIFHADSDKMGGSTFTTIISLVTGLLNVNLSQYYLDNGSYIGIDQLGWDLNVLLPDLMNWLFEGKKADGIKYYENVTNVLSITDGSTTTEVVYTLDNINDIDFNHYNVADRNGNALTANRDKDNNITSYSYLGKTDEDLKVLLADYADTEFLCSYTYSSSVPYITGIYIADLALRDAKISDMSKLLTSLTGNSTLGAALGEVVTELAQLFRAAVNEFVNSDRVNQTRYNSAGESVFSGLNNVFVALPQLFDIMEDLAAEKYGIDKDAWTYCYDGKIVVDENNSYSNSVVETFKAYAASNDPNRSVDILDTFADLFVGDWLNAIFSIVNNAVSTDNKITQNIPIVTGLLNSLGGFGETSIITDIFNGVFQIDRNSKYSFTFEKRENGLTGLSKDHAYFLITNIKTLVNVITNLIGKFGSSESSISTTADTVASSGSTSKAAYQPKAAKPANADKSSYTNQELSNATDLINNLDKMFSSLLSDASFNGFNLNSTNNIFAGIVTFFSNYLGNDCYTELGKLLNSYVFYITGSETHTPDANGNVDAKKVYTNESLTGLVVETFLLIEKVVENLLADYSDTYTLDNGSKAQYNLLVEAIEGVISPDAIGVRLTGYDKVQKKLADYNCWHNAAAQTSRGDYKIKLDWGIKAGDKDAFYDGLAASLRLVTSILSVLLIDTNWYETVVSPILGALCTPNGIKIDTAKQFKAAKDGYHDEALLGIILPIAEWFNLFLSKPATTLIKSVQGIAGILDDKNGATIASILKGAITPLTNEIKGLGKIFALKTDKLLPTSLTLQSLLNSVANIVSTYANANNIKIGDYSLSGTNIIPIINSLITDTGISLKQINWNKLSTAKTPAAALVYVLEYLFEVLLDNDNLTAFAKLIGNDTVTMLIDLIKSGGITAGDILHVLNRILEATDSPTLAYWTFAQYLQEITSNFSYPAGITKQMADNGVTSLDDLIAGIFPLLSSFGVDLGGDNLQAIINKNLFKNELITKLATALYGALDGLDPTIKDVLKGLGIVTSTKDVAKLLTDKSYGTTFTSAANTIKAQSSWKNVKNVNWGFTDGSAKAQQGFVNALAAVLRPLNDVLAVFLNEGSLQFNEVLYDVICSLDVPYTVQVITLSDSKDAPIELKFSYRMKDGILRLKFREYEGNRERSRSSELRFDFTSLKDLKDFKLEGTNAYNSAIIPLLEAFQCSNISTYAQYQKDVAKAKDNLLLDILNPLIGNSSSSFLNKLAANPVSELTKLLPNVALYLDSNGLVQLVSNLLAPITYIITDDTNPMDLGIGEFINDLLGGSTADIIIPLVNMILDSNDIGIELAEIDWDFLINLGDVTTYKSKATGTNGKFLTGKTVSNVDQGKVLITVLRYVANLLIDNTTLLKNLICSIDKIKNSDKADMIISIITSVFNTISTASADQIVSAIFYLLAGQPQNAFWDYTSYKTGSYSFSYPADIDVDFLKSLPPMLDGLIGGLADLNELISNALFKDELISKLATGLYGAIEGVKINDNMNLTQLLAKTDIDFSTDNVAKLLVDKDYGQTFESAASVISAAGSWKNVNVNSLKWGVTDRDSFFHALVSVLRPLYGVLDVLLNDAYLGLFDLVRLPGSNGYTSSIVPLMEAFSMYNIKTQYQYRQDIIKEYDALLLDIINPLWDLVEDVLSAPLQTVTAIIPNLALFIGNNGLCQIFDNLLTPISALIDSISPIVDLNDLLDTLFDALDFDLNSLLGKIGVTNFSLDIYDISKTLKPVLGADAIIPLLNSVLGLIDIKGAKLDLKLNAVDWLKLASHGTTVVAASQAATYGSRIFVQGDSSETLIAILRYLIDTVNTGDNFNKVSSLIGGLIGGDGGDSGMTDTINNVLGLLQGDTDKVIFDLVDLLQSLA